MSKILSVKEIEFKDDKDKYITLYEGIIIELEDGTKYKLGIEAGGQCCEQFGYVTSQDDYEDFIGAEFLDCYLTTKELCTIEDLPDVYEGNMMFFTIKTNKGDLQFVAYNDHNGYYSHDVVLIKNADVLEKCDI